MKVAPRTVLRGFVVAQLGVVLACTGANVPPKQASGPDTPDPMSESSSSPASTGAGGGNKGGGGGGDPLAPPSHGGGKPATGKGGEPPSVTTLAPFLDGLKWGISHAEIQKQFTQTGGVIWKDYDEKLAKARVGPEQTALEAEREREKNAFVRSFIEFKDTPTGYDTTGIRNEYSYKNKEALMWITRQGKKRYFFFIGDKLWKLYDEVPLEEGGAMGKTFDEAVASSNPRLVRPD